MRQFRYVRPRSLSEVFDLLDAYGPEARVLAGGTDLVVGLENGRLRPPVVVDLKRVRDLPAGIEERDGRIVIAAPTVLADIVRDDRIRLHFPALVDAACCVGSVQIRNRATLTGNVCNASPAADTAPALLVHDAVLVLLGRDGVRRLPVREFLLGPRHTDLRVGEIAAAIELPLPSPPLGTAFARLTRRRGVDLATISVCCAVGPRVTRFGYGAVAPRPFLVEDDSGVLAASGSGEQDREAVLRRVVAQAAPITDVRGGRDYRLAMLMVFSRRALVAARARRDAG